eukprot:GILK01006476.1.p1 GENE.GILK01006476.1~~GILK01006476.1.p1  ORF type:complete len:238 (-),score=15.13 GILK01006476.1:195-908(-)
MDDFETILLCQLRDVRSAITLQIPRGKYTPKDMDFFFNGKDVDYLIDSSGTKVLPEMLPDEEYVSFHLEAPYYDVHFRPPINAWDDSFLNGPIQSCPVDQINIPSGTIGVFVLLDGENCVLYVGRSRKGRLRAAVIETIRKEKSARIVKWFSTDVSMASIRKRDLKNRYLPNEKSKPGILSTFIDNIPFVRSWLQHSDTDISDVDYEDDVSTTMRKLTVCELPTSSSDVLLQKAKQF